MTPTMWCCAQMTAQQTQVCPDHPDPADCPDRLVSYDAETDTYGLWIHDGGHSFIALAYCPWCGAHLAPCTMPLASAAEFVRLRSSAEIGGYLRAAHAPASEAIWEEIIATWPEMRFWVAQNKTVPLAILKVLMHDPDRRVRSMVADKRKADAAILTHLAQDADSGVRMSVARHRKTPPAVLEQLRDDSWADIRAVVAARLSPPDPAAPAAEGA
ncbi:MAG TPA: HEAT repeat domain-containing protein [Herpetosiphonaceae bacterium]